METIDTLKSVISKRRGVARSNLFRVYLPTDISGSHNLSSDELNVLCTNVNLPGRQILTQERLIGIKGRKMPTGFASDDVSMTFYCLNDYGIREYFEAWQDLIISQNTYEIAYTNEYCRDIEIAQLKKGMGFDVPIDRIFGLNVDIDIRTKEEIIYKCKLLEAFPTTMNAIELSNELDGLVQLNVQLSYRNWSSI